MTDLFGKALLDYQSGNYKDDIITYSSLHEQDLLALPYLFRTYETMPALEHKALELCRGKVLDIGCGAGPHALYLQESGFDVTGLDISPGAIATCTARGLKKTLTGSIYDIDGMKFDTLLLLMNGIGLVGSLSDFHRFFDQIKLLLEPGGQIIFDSSDIIYMFDDGEAGTDMVCWTEPHEDADIENYYGEVTFILEYKGQKSHPFKWLYLDYQTLSMEAGRHQMNCELLMKGKHYDYLARLTMAE